MLVNSIAINSIFNLAIMGLYFAYCMPLIARLAFGYFKPGVWYMGDKLSYASAVYSVLCKYISVFNSSIYFLFFTSVKLGRYSDSSSLHLLKIMQGCHSSSPFSSSPPIQIPIRRK